MLCCAVLPVYHRVKALDLIQRDFVSLSEEPHSFPVADDLSKLLQQLYGCAAAALAMLSEQVRCRDTPTQACAASEQILKVCVARWACTYMLADKLCCAVHDHDGA